MERIQNGLPPSLKQDYAQLPSSLLATLDQKPFEDVSTNSSSSPVSCSPSLSTKNGTPQRTEPGFEHLFKGTGTL